MSYLGSKDIYEKDDILGLSKSGFNNTQFTTVNLFFLISNFYFQLTSKDGILPALPFRTSKEALNILSNIADVCSVSLWSEYSAVTTEMMNKLSCLNVTVNCYSPNNPLTGNSRVQQNMGLPGSKVSYVIFNLLAKVKM